MQNQNEYKFYHGIVKENFEQKQGIYNSGKRKRERRVSEL